MFVIMYKTASNLQKDQGTKTEEHPTQTHNIEEGQPGSSLTLEKDNDLFSKNTLNFLCNEVRNVLVILIDMTYFVSSCSSVSFLWYAFIFSIFSTLKRL